MNIKNKKMKKIKGNKSINDYSFKVKIIQSQIVLIKDLNCTKISNLKINNQINKILNFIL